MSGDGSSVFAAAIGAFVLNELECVSIGAEHLRFRFDRYDFRRPFGGPSKAYVSKSSPDEEDDVESLENDELTFGSDDTVLLSSEL